MSSAGARGSRGRHPEHTPDQLRNAADELAEAVRVAAALPAVTGIG
ncbi:hypothetical protein [Nocardia caishijiensis]|nr:hypothetical protein [Nocardia caishijiensis]